jgi:hypothetical protein
MTKSNFLWRQSLTRIQIRFGLAPLMRNRIDVKRRIRIHIETNADLQH